MKRHARDSRHGREKAAGISDQPEVSTTKPELYVPTKSEYFCSVVPKTMCYRRVATRTAQIPFVIAHIPPRSSSPNWRSGFSTRTLP